MEKFKVVGSVFVDTLSDFVLFENAVDVLYVISGVIFTLVLMFLPVISGLCLIGFVEKKYKSNGILRFCLMITVTLVVQMLWTVKFISNMLVYLP